MGHSVTLGGERVGSGNKNKVYLHNYERSTHNLSEKFSSTMGVGMLIPFMCKLATRDDKFEIDLSAGLRTIPTKGPLFGSFKLQLDVFQCPLRLYQALLHNNPLAIGLKANQVKFPKIRLYDQVDAGIEYKLSEAARNSLVRYLGVSGIGTLTGDVNCDTEVSRDFFGAGVLAYYDIFKNYYANKQEEKAYTCTSGNVIAFDCQYIVKYEENVVTGESGNYNVFSVDDAEKAICNLTIITDRKLQKEEFEQNRISFEYLNGDESKTISNVTIKRALELGYIRRITYGLNEPNEVQIIWNTWHIFNSVTWQFSSITMSKTLGAYTTEVILKPFDLKNIDDMRMEILSFHQLGQSFVLDGTDASTGGVYPYLAAIGSDHTSVDEQYSWKKPLAGLCVKTYQSDIFNNWINTEWIDGENGIAAITAISTSDGKITIDALNFSEKLYNLLNRIAVSGATYEDYLDAAYTDSAKKFCEAPMWIGGMSDEIVFEEIVQTNSGDEASPLGTLAGRGNLLGKHKGGKITVKIDEPSLIIGIVSITPRINYTQGNEWFNTEVDSLMDIHVPALDGIAFQNLLGERLHFGSTVLDTNGVIQDRPIIGKIPAWLEYMTSYDRAFGDFAATGGDGYMILQRDYLCEDGELKDATTYIDPAKYNYAFAYTKRDAQNFWVQIHSKIIARRLMSAKQIPNV